jgi:hypothetical protein
MKCPKPRCFVCGCIHRDSDPPCEEPPKCPVCGLPHEGPTLSYQGPEVTDPQTLDGRKEGWRA